MNVNFSVHHFRFHIQPKVPLHMPAYNKGNVIRGGFGSTFRRIVCHGNCRTVFVIVLVAERMHGGAGGCELMLDARGGLSIIPHGQVGRGGDWLAWLRMS
jgi:hypothetical protein